MKKLSLLILMLLITLINLNQIQAQASPLVISGHVGGWIVKHDDNGNFINEIRPFGSFAINTLFTSVDQFIYVTSDNNTFAKIDSNLNIIWSHTTAYRPDGIWVDLDDNIFIIRAGGRLRKYDSNRQFIYEVPTNGTGIQKIVGDNLGRIYASLSADSTRPGLRVFDSNNGNLINETGIGFQSFGLSLSNDNSFVYLGRQFGNVYKYDTNLSLIWTNSNHSQTVLDISTLSNNDIVTVSADSTVKRISSNGGQIWSTSVSNPSAVMSDKLDNIYVGTLGNLINKYDSNGTLIWSRNPNRGQVRSITVESAIEPEPPFYDVNISSNFQPYTDIIYFDSSLSLISSSFSAIIANDESFTLSTSAINISPFVFNFWLDLDTQQIFSTERTFTIVDPNQNYNLQANYSLSNGISLSLNSNLPSPPNFNVSTTSIEGQEININKYPFNNEQIPFGYEFVIEAPTDNVGFYEFDYWYDNINDRVFTNSAIVTLEAIENYDLTAFYSLPLEFQINLTLETQIGNIIFQHGNLPPISGTSISAIIGQGDSWTATAPLTQDYLFDIWLDEETNNVFGTNRTLTVNNTTRNYLLRAFYLELVTVNWDSLGGTPIPSQKIILGNSINPPNNPLRPNFVFAGWAIPSAPNTPITFPQFPTQTITYQAIWLPTYQLTFNVNAGQPIPSQEIIENNPPTVVTPSRFGYTFDGWYTDNITFNNEFDFNAPFTSNTTIHAKWIFGTTANAETSLQSFLGNARLDNPIAQWIIVLSLFILLNVMIFVYKGPFIVTVILNFILTALFIVFGFIPIWITIVLFMAIFGFMILMLSGGQS